MHIPTFLRRPRVLAPAAVLAAGILTLGAYGVSSRLDAATGSPAAVTAATPSESGPAASSRTVEPLATASYADAVERAIPAVVTVQVQQRAQRLPVAGWPDDPFFRRFFGPGPAPQEGPAPMREGLGSGVIVESDGTILTNHHVVDGAEHVTVVLSDGRELPARVVGTDSPTDLAVLDIEGENLPTLPMADSDRVRVGDVVLAVGNPLGIGQTVTMGIVSAKSRSTGVGGDGSYEDFLQTDAPINRGNSGGALITTGGELVGINSQILSTSGGNIGIGFAIPSNLAKNVMSQLLTSGTVRRGMLGVTVQPVTSALADGLGLSAVGGALVSSVQEEGPAAQAGIGQGDVILRVNGAEVGDSNDLRNRIGSLTPGSAVTLDVVRDGQERQVRVTLGELPSSERPAAAASGSVGERGLTLERLTPDMAARLGLPRNSGGVIVTGIEPGSPAARAGLRQGDLIRQVNNRRVTNPAEVRELLSQEDDGRPALLLVERDGQPLYLAVPRS
jgi:Do/DeqQ family serine protease